jgi:predicted nucleotidyltransferase
MNRNELIERIKKDVGEIEPSAEVILYGSQSRHDADPESDWDLLILVDGPLNDQRTDRIRHRLYKLEWEFGEVISSIVRSRADWDSALYKAMPFHQRVRQEGIRL